MTTFFVLIMSVILQHSSYGRYQMIAKQQRVSYNAPAQPGQRPRPAPALHHKFPALKHFLPAVQSEAVRTTGVHCSRGAGSRLFEWNGNREKLLSGPAAARRTDSPRLVADPRLLQPLDPFFSPSHVYHKRFSRNCWRGLPFVCRTVNTVQHGGAVVT